jgi:hypothetical protein
VRHWRCPIHGDFYDSVPFCPQCVQTTKARLSEKPPTFSKEEACYGNTEIPVLTRQFYGAASAPYWITLME